MNANPLSKAVQLVGLLSLAEALGLTYQAIRRWEKAGRLPRSEHTGETSYAQDIEIATGGQVKAADLLAWSSAGWKPAAAEAA
jgi:hypothetical protein